jgi:hypothetical protein
MKLLLPCKTIRTSASQTLHNILVKVLLYIGSSMALAVGCQPEGTCCQCCFVLTGRLCFVDVAVASAAGAEARAPAGEGILLLTIAPPELLFLVRSVTA